MIHYVPKPLSHELVSDPAQTQVSFMQKHLVMLCAHHEEVTRGCKQQGQCSAVCITLGLLGQDNMPLRYRFTHLPTGKQYHPAFNGIHR